MSQHAQLTLGLSLPEDKTFTGFWLGDNGAVVSHLQQLFDSDNDRFCFCWGDSGAGKTHLLQATCTLAQQRGSTTCLIPLSQHQELTPAVLEGLEQIDLVCIDDLQCVLGNAAWEEALFHFYNRYLPSQARLIVTSQSPPNQCPIQLADLRSRMNAGAIYQVKTLSDDDKLGALQQYAAQRGMSCSEQVAEYILNHCGRDMASLVAVMRVLDEATLAAKRTLTIPFIKQALAL